MYEALNVALVQKSVPAPELHNVVFFVVVDHTIFFFFFCIKLIFLIWASLPEESADLVHLLIVMFSCVC